SASFEEMHARLERIRAKIKAAPQKGILQIGCIVVVNAMFFLRDEWIPQPRDWAESNLRHTVYDLDVGEGARVWAEMLGASSAPSGIARRRVGKWHGIASVWFSCFGSATTWSRSVPRLGDRGVQPRVRRNPRTFIACA